MSTKPYLLLDAGGTLLFIDQVYLSQTAQALGFQVDAARFYEEHFRIMHWLDAYIRDHRQFPPRVNKPYPQILFEAVGLPEEAAAQAGQVAESAHKKKNLWTFTFPWVVETLDRLSAAGYRMSIISNSDGRMEQQLLDLKLRRYFERVYDSKLVGSQKPEPHIFHLALAELGLRPEEAVYVGDLFYIDIWGANRAGVPAMHLDPLGLYVGWPGEHIQDVRQLPGWLQGYVQARRRYDVLPLRDFAMLPENE